MSEADQSAPQGGGDDTSPTPEPAATPAPVNEGAATEADETTEVEPRPSRGDRRFVVLSARMAALENENARLRRGGDPGQQEQPQIPPEWQPWIERQVETRAAEHAAQARVNAFHEAGEAAHPGKWRELCQDVIEMGSDPELSRLLVETPDGHRIVAALADDPEELQRIASLRGERARAIAIGKFAARLEERPAPPRRAAVSRAPAPIRPVTGAVNAAPNPYLMSADQAADYFMAQDMKNRSRN